LTIAVGKLWMAGAKIDWGGYYEGEKRRRVSLPAYPFERRRYWVDARRELGGSGRSKDGGGPAGKLGDVRKWFYVTGWQRRELGRNADAGQGEKQRKYVVLEGGGSLGRNLVQRLRMESTAVISVRAGERYRRVGESEYEIRAGEKRNYGK